MPAQIVVTRNTNEFIITDKNKKNLHLMFDAQINRWVRELNEKYLHVTSFSPMILPDKVARKPNKTQFTVTFICEDVSPSGRNRLPAPYKQWEE